MNFKMILRFVILLLLATMVVACTQTKEVEVTRIVTEVEEVESVVEVEVTRVVIEVQEVEVTRVVTMDAAPDSFVSLSVLARNIQDGEVDVGDEFGMAQGQRFHVIHADVVDMKCIHCHVDEALLEVAQPSNITDEAPGVVDRRVCLGCHLTGPATKLYEPKE